MLNFRKHVACIPHDRTFCVPLDQSSRKCYSIPHGLPLDETPSTRNITCPTSLELTCSKRNVVISTSAYSATDKKREYLVDYLPFTWTKNVFGFNEVKICLLNGLALWGIAGVMPDINKLLMEHEAYAAKFEAIRNSRASGRINMFQEMRQMSELGPQPQEITSKVVWDIVVKHFHVFYVNTSKTYISRLFRKALELIAVENLTPRAADKVTKDLTKSLKRKLLRFPDQRIVVTQKIFGTAFYANLFISTSNFAADVVMTSITALYRDVKEGKSLWNLSMNSLKPRRMLNTLAWLSSKVILAFSIHYANCGGYAIGTYMFGQSWGASLCMLVSELATTVAVSPLINMFL